LTAKVTNRVLLTLLLFMLAAALGLPLLTDAPNRLVDGHGIALSALMQGKYVWLLLPFGVLAVQSFARQSRRAQVLSVVCATVLLTGLTMLAGTTATALSGGPDSFVRISFGGGFWLLFGLNCLAATDAIARATASRPGRIFFNLLVFMPVALLLVGGQLDQLSIMKEYVNRNDVFDAAVVRHLQIVVLTLLVSVTLGLPIGLAAMRYRRVQRGLFPVLNVIQTIPSLALFGLLIAPLAALATRFPWLAAHGVSGTGMTPAIIALVMYSLLPLARSTVAGLEQVPSGVIEAAHGMGLTGWQVFLRVEAPLALPVFLSGLRITAVQAVGLTVVAALIGAGGLGGLVFQGLLSGALDLVLLGVIPVVVLAVVVDSGFKLIVTSLQAKQHVTQQVREEAREETREQASEPTRPA
jgi:osmoprotectant transport system permease protein